MSDALSSEVSPDVSPVWPSRLHHIRRNSDQPERLVGFFHDGLGLEVTELGDGVWSLTGPGRRLLVGHGGRGTLGFAAFTLDDAAQLDALRAHVEAAGIAPGASPSPLLEGDAFAIADPDGNKLVFGLPPVGEKLGESAEQLPGRLQHFVVATADIDPMIEFYRDKLGMLVSDYVREVGDDNGSGPDGSGDVTACFLRTDPEHHSFAVFRAPAPGLDHHAYETSGWIDIRDWADRFAEMRVPLWWGPGRHGVGNNLFFMVEDPDGSKVELSAELETCPPEQEPGEWEHGERALNLWGNAWMRS